MSLFARAAALSPLGPIFGKELRVASRRKRTYVLRSVYLGLLLVAMLIAWSATGVSYSGGGVAAQAERQTQLGIAFFIAFTIVSVGSMGLIGPVLTSNAIGAEKLAKTLPVLLITPINAWQVVSGKLFSRALAALTLIGLSLPVLALVRLLGGVELEQMVAVVCIAISVMLACAALGLFYSLFINRAAFVILLAYATMGVTYMLVPMLIMLFAQRPDATAIKLVAAINPMMAAATQMLPMPRAFVGDVWIVCVVVHLGTASVLVAATALLLRRHFRNAGEKPVAVSTLAPMPMSSAIAPPALPASPALSVSTAPSSTDPPRSIPPPLPAVGPAPSLTKSRSRNVGDNPVAWRELRQPLLRKTWQKGLSVLFVMGALILVYAGLAADNNLDDVATQIGFAVILYGIWWLLASILSATAIAQEKESDTWTLLLATPLSGSSIVFGKIVGLYRRMLWPTALMLFHFSIFALAGVIPVWTVGVVLWLLITTNSLWIVTGVYLSLRFGKTLFAVVVNLLLPIVLYGVVPLILTIPEELLGLRNNRLSEEAAWYVPYCYLSEVFESEYRYEYGHDFGDAYWTPIGNVDLSTYLMFVFFCGFFHLLAAVGVLTRSAHNFDQIVHRAGRRRFLSVRDSDRSVFPDAIESSSSDASSIAVGVSPDPSIYAHPFRRLAAWLIDTLIVQFFCGIVALAMTILDVVNATQYERFERGPSDIAAALISYLWVCAGVGVLVGILYGAFFESRRSRATPGKQLLSIFVTDAQGRRLGFNAALLRNAIKPIGIAILIGPLAALLDPRRQTLHDKSAGSLVLTH